MSAHDAAPADIYFTKHEAASYLRRCIRTIEKLTAAGELPAYRVRGKLLFRRGDLDAYVDAQRVRPRGSS